jgi:lipopolysaccharide/colanic/teichoic acid biosynthesis glycosyltransferase
MKKEISLIKFIFVVLDFLLFFLALSLTLFFRFGFNFSSYFQEHFLPFFFLFFFYLLLLFAFNLYDFYLLNLKNLFQRISSFTFSALILGIIYFYFGQTIFKISPKTNLLIFLFLFILFLSFSRILIFKFFYRKKIEVYFLGEEKLKEKLEKDLQNHQFFDFRGYYFHGLNGSNTDYTDKFIHGSNGSNTDKTDNINPHKSALDPYKSVNKILVIAPHYHLKSKEFQLILNSEITTFDFIDFYEKFLGRIPLEAINSDWLLKYLSPFHSKIYFYFKRSLDLILASLIFIFLFVPLFIPISLLIYLSDPGSIFFKNLRVGYKKKIFSLLKFRTMKEIKKNKESWAVGEEEKRIFSFGKLLRKTHLDELPQILNIFKGELTLVGPRPEQPGIFSQLEKEIPFYELRVLVLPGITGWAQVNYKYPENFEETKIKLEYDLYYLKNYNLFLDLLIIIKTIQKLLTF